MNRWAIFFRPDGLGFRIHHPCHPWLNPSCSRKSGRTSEWQNFRTKKERTLELQSIFHECVPGRRKIAVKVVDIFGNDTMTIVDVSVGKNR